MVTEDRIRNGTEGFDNGKNVRGFEEAKLEGESRTTSRPVAEKKRRLRPEPESRREKNGIRG